MDRIVQEGFIPFRGFRIWYRIVGESRPPGRLPLLCLHGGPGAPHDYLEPLEAVADTGRRVIFYDQLGCGNSDHPHDPSLWSVGLFVEELAAVRRALGLDRVHLLGQSWGGMLALEHALTRPPGLASLVIASSPASMPQWVAEAGRLRAELPPETREALWRHEADGTTDEDEYQDAEQAYYHRHVCRLDPWPECLVRTFDRVAEDPEVYLTMNGPSEFHVTGRLKDWDITGRLGEIRVPALITSGHWDEATPAIAETIHRGIPGSRWILFEESAHMAHLEETDRYLRELCCFLDEVEAGAPVRPARRAGRAAGAAR